MERDILNVINAIRKEVPEAYLHGNQARDTRWITDLLDRQISKLAWAAKGRREHVESVCYDDMSYHFCDILGSADCDWKVRIQKILAGEL